MIDDLDLAVTQFVTLWAVLDPVGHLPLFLGATEGLDASERRRAALLSVLFAFITLAAFAVAGQALLHAMGVSLLSFQIAGGIVLMLFAIRMVLGESSHGAAVQGATDRKASVVEVAVYPLAVPIIAGPGALLTIVLLMDNNRDSIAHRMETLGVLAAVLALLLCIFLLGGLIARVLGAGGANLLRRVMGLILSAVAVNLILNALTQWLKLPPI